MVGMYRVGEDDWMQSNQSQKSPQDQKRPLRQPIAELKRPFY
ncbi:hypothetical protein VCR26J2_370694 [Vibrio coralliirubri]|nr:hypothetical protein VCR26J2_370694 [Vibrio coralliirubri]